MRLGTWPVVPLEVSTLKTSLSGTLRSLCVLNTVTGKKGTSSMRSARARADHHRHGACVRLTALAVQRGEGVERRGERAPLLVGRHAERRCREQLSGFAVGGLIVDLARASSGRVSTR